MASVHIVVSDRVSLSPVSPCGDEWQGPWGEIQVITGILLMSFSSPNYHSDTVLGGSRASQLPFQSQFWFSSPNTLQCHFGSHHPPVIRTFIAVALMMCHLASGVCLRRFFFLVILKFCLDQNLESLYKWILTEMTTGQKINQYMLLTYSGVGRVAVISFSDCY